MSYSSGTVIESQVDWLTVSAHGEDAASNMLDLAHGLAKEAKTSGNRESPWRTMGYEGIHCGPIDYGQRDKQSTILRLSGDSAQKYLTVALSLADAVTRIDLATTWRGEPPDEHVGANCFTMAEQWWKQNKRRARPELKKDAGSEGNCYIGARSSENYFRIYDKERECREEGDDDGATRYAGCWRFELEVKGGLAGTLADRVLSVSDQADYTQMYMYQWLEAHGVEPPFSALGGRVLLPGFRRRSDADSKLRHLAKNVRPTLDWLREQGRWEDVERVLGLG